jgi:phosphoglycolate phosphatase-like HAD superfamily hydrolase
VCRSKWRLGATGEIYLFGLQEEDSPALPTRNRELYTPGLRFSRKAADAAWDFDFESAIQFGTLRGSYTFAASGSPHLAVLYDYASGDKSSADNDSNRFDTLYGARRFEHGPTGIYGAFARSNIQSPGVRISRKPHAQIDGMIGYRAYWLASDTDAWTTSGLRDASAEPLASWNDGPVKKAMVDFVARVTRTNGPDYVAPAERIAVFDNDGTLWSEQPIYVQLAFAIDRVRALSARHPDCKTTQPFKSAIEGDIAALFASGDKGVLQIVAASHAGMTTEEFDAIVHTWLMTARHPQLGRPYSQLVYQPMLELLAYLRANGFKTFIVSGGGVEFMRAFAEKAYGIPPEQVVGSYGTTTYQLTADGTPALVKEAKVEFISDGPGKPTNINRCAPFSRSATQTVINRCCNGPPQGAVRGSSQSFVTRMPSVSSPTIGTRTSVASTKRSKRPSHASGLWSI